VEGEKLKQDLLLMGLLNAEIVPNFKRIPPLPGTPNRSKYPVNFVFLSRVTPSKGVTLIFEAVKLLNTDGYSDSFTVTFFGPLDHKFEITFKDGLNQQLVYGGVLDLMNAPAEMYEKLASYNCMLFPTYWESEGLPGVIIDAFIAGLPVIASDWNMNKELIHDWVNGFIIQPINPASLAVAMKKAIDNPDLLKQLSDNARMRAKDYDIEKIGQQILQILDAPLDEKTEVSVSVE
jgi:glycosyltransferase involved in cell wall biosynthesis